jgi:hypothetical protein
LSASATDPIAAEPVATAIDQHERVEGWSLALYLEHEKGRETPCCCHRCEIEGREVH